MRRGTVAVAFTALALFGSAAVAQQPGQQRVPATLTLQEAIRIAMENSPDSRKLANDLEVADAEARQSWGAFLPNLSASLGSSGSRSTTYTGQDPLGRHLEEPVAVTSQTSGSSQGVSMQVTLFNGAMFSDLSRARASARRTQADVRAQSATIAANVTRNFYQARQREMLADVERRNLANARDRLDRAEQMFRLAANTQVDLLGAQQDVITAERLLADAESEHRKALLLLQESMGIDGDIAFELSGELPETFDPSLLDANRIVEQAMQSSPAVLAAEASYAAARSGSSAARARRWPTLNGSVNFNRSEGEQGYGGIGNLNPRNHSLSFSVGVSIPLFSRFQTSFQIAQAEAAADDAGEDLRRARLQTEREIRAGLVDLEKAYRGLQAAEQIAALAAQQLEIAEERFQTGAADMDFLRLQQIVQQEEQARRSVVDARFTFLTALVALEEKLGAPLSR